MHTVLETATFTARAERRLTVEELYATIDAIAKNPAAGDVIKDTGGVRKIRVAVGGRGKSGGARVIYFFFNEQFPIYLLTVFTKNEKSDLSAKERNELLKLTTALKAAWRPKKKGE